MMNFSCAAACSSGSAVSISASKIRFHMGAILPVWPSASRKTVQRKARSGELSDDCRFSLRRVSARNFR
jgi:hypothetical protein